MIGDIGAADEAAAKLTLAAASTRAMRWAATRATLEYHAELALELVDAARAALLRARGGKV